jgi:hypothetical protein
MNNCSRIRPILFGLLTVIPLAVYFPVLGHDFQYYWDDQWQIINQYTEGGLSFQNIWTIFTTPYGGQYSPVTGLMHLLLYTVFGYNPFWFHAASLLLHIANTLLIFVCIERLLETGKQFEIEYKPGVAFVAALIFACHPLNVETVAWLSASKILVYTFFYLLATLAFLSYLNRGKVFFYFLTLFLFACSFGGKEQAVCFPLWLMLLYWLNGHSFKSRKVWLALMPFLLSLSCLEWLLFVPMA